MSTIYSWNLSYSCRREIRVWSIFIPYYESMATVFDYLVRCFNCPWSVDGTDVDGYWPNCIRLGKIEIPGIMMHIQNAFPFISIRMMMLINGIALSVDAARANTTAFTRRHEKPGMHSSKKIQMNGVARCARFCCLFWHRVGYLLVLNVIRCCGLCALSSPRKYIVFCFSLSLFSFRLFGLSCSIESCP